MEDNRTGSTRRRDEGEIEHRRVEHRRKQNLHVDNDSVSIDQIKRRVSAKRK